MNIHQQREICEEAKRAVDALKLKMLATMETVLGVSKDDPDVHRYVDGVLYGPKSKIEELTNILNRDYVNSIP